MANPETVDEIVANGGRPIEKTRLHRLLEHLRALPEQCAPLERCEEILGDVEFPRGDVLARIQERILCIDLTAPITPETPVHIVSD